MTPLLPYIEFFDIFRDYPASQPGLFDEQLRHNKLRAPESETPGYEPFQVRRRSEIPSKNMGTSPIRKRPPFLDPLKTLGMRLRYGPRGVRCLMSDIPLYPNPRGGVCGLQDPHILGVLKPF